MSDPGARAPAGEPVERTLEKVLHHHRYPFCTDERGPLRDDHALCRFARENPACPAFAKACTAVRPREESEFTFGAPGLGGLATVVFWVLIGAIVLWCMTRIAKNFQDGGASLAQPVGGGKPRTGSEAEPEPEEIVEKDPSKLLAWARDALARGDQHAATRIGHAALVRALERAGHLVVDRSSTNGDYARALRGVPEFRDVFRAAATEVERCEFSAERPSPERVSRLLARIEPVVARVLAVAGMVVALLGTSCSGVDGMHPEDAPGGDSILRQLFELRGATYARRMRPVAELWKEDTDLIVLDPSAELSKEDWAHLGTWVENGGTLALLGPPADIPKRFGVDERTYVPCTAAPAISLETLAGARIAGAESGVRLSKEWDPVVVCGDASLVAQRRLGTGRFILFADERFLSNASLSRTDHARLAFTLFARPRRVNVVDRWITASAADPYRAIANSGLGPVLGQGLLWLLLWALARGVAFGARPEPAEVPRTAFSEHVRALGQLYARARGTRHALSSYSSWALERLGARFRSGSSARMLDLASAIAAATGRSEAHVAQILTEAFQARDDRDAAINDSQDLATLAALDDLMHEAGGHK